MPLLLCVAVFVFVLVIFAGFESDFGSNFEFSFLFCCCHAPVLLWLALLSTPRTKDRDDMNVFVPKD